jgi:hypothetical protein
MLATYSKFHSKEEAEVFTRQLLEAGIYHELEVERDVLDKVYTGQTLDPMIAVKVPVSEFNRVNSLVEQDVALNTAQIAPDYYLFQFTNEELVDVLKNPDEWNQFDRSLAKKLLAERNVDPAVVQVNDPPPNYTPARLTAPLLAMEYLLAVTVAFAGIVIGLATLFATKTLRNGNPVPIYDAYTRNHAKVLVAIGVIRTAVIFFTPYGWLPGPF